MLATIAAVAAILAPGNAPDVNVAHRVAFVSSTAYCVRGRMANGRYVHTGAVAMNSVPLGTRVRVSRSPTGLRWHRVEDRIGYGSQFDFWVPSCAQARAWGRRTVRVTY
jgi:3D (Asp-Asp-Asp) domain-containing protein